MKLKQVAASIPQLSLEVVKTSPDPPAPGAKTRVSLRLRPSKSNDAGALILTDERADVFVVSQDLSWLTHAAASMAPDGEASISVEFPQPGRFTFFVDLGANQPKVTPMEYSLSGAAPADHPLAPDAKPQGIGDGYEVSVLGAPLRAGERSTLSFAIKLNGAPPKVLGRTLGEGARLILVPQDRASWLNLRATPAQNDKPEAAGAHPSGDLSFDVAVPAPGLYAAWLEFQHGQKAGRARFVLEASP
jgi:hypothetical protein